MFYHREAAICVLPKVANLDVQIWVFFGNCVFSTVKHNCLLYLDQTNSGIFSLDLSQHLSSLFKQLLVLLDEAPLPHFGILQHDIFVPGTQRVWDELFAAGPRSINSACMAYDGGAAALDIFHKFATIANCKKNNISVLPRRTIT